MIQLSPLRLLLLSAGPRLLALPPGSPSMRSRMPPSSPLSLLVRLPPALPLSLAALTVWTVLPL